MSTLGGREGVNRQEPKRGRAIHKEEVKVPLDGLEQMFSGGIRAAQLYQLQLRARQTDIGRIRLKSRLTQVLCRQAESGVRPISAS